MLSFSSFSIRDILTGRVAPGGVVGAAWDTCSTNRGFKGPGLMRQGEPRRVDAERHCAGLSASEGHNPPSPDPLGGQTAGEAAADREGELKAFWPQWKLNIDHLAQLHMKGFF